MLSQPRPAVLQASTLRKDLKPATVFENVAVDLDSNVTALVGGGLQSRKASVSRDSSRDSRVMALGIVKLASSHSTGDDDMIAAGGYRSLLDFGGKCCEDMRELLIEVGLERLERKFAAEEITPDMLPYLDDAALRDLGVSSVGSRLRLRMLAGRMRGMSGR
ncbi:hypothetical protein CEUSTIGMA_g4024.t1 [Chlamydomonas eustigma]|uniref:SAM domain-containing protein n=1 Tax=Chlamydomonas eustigma TaxID=1157962 RepID=A0A250X0I0_9CHLO|nr:hypothetical protein CEUSTIGMA_g4024.t1 [Chlamydomonas eustigma]|eukprot:GAX76578.1 hypothetical protein CEUSTIGMA_g4024.t1 [Chlamydomonas eustigma]